MMAGKELWRVAFYRLQEAIIKLDNLAEEKGGGLPPLEKMTKDACAFYIMQADIREDPSRRHGNRLSLSERHDQYFHFIRCLKYLVEQRALEILSFHDFSADRVSTWDLCLYHTFIIAFRDYLQNGTRGGTNPQEIIHVLISAKPCRRMKVINIFSTSGPYNTLLAIDIPEGRKISFQEGRFALAHEIAHFAGVPGRQRQMRNQLIKETAAAQIAATLGLYTDDVAVIILATLNNEKTHGKIFPSDTLAVDPALLEHLLPLSDYLKLCVDFFLDPLRIRTLADVYRTSLINGGASRYEAFEEAENAREKIFLSFGYRGKLHSQIETVISLYSETYADLAAICSLGFEPDQYVQAFVVNEPYIEDLLPLGEECPKQNEAHTMARRLYAVLRAVYEEEKTKKYPGADWDDFKRGEACRKIKPLLDMIDQAEEDLIVVKLVEYLRSCYNKHQELYDPFAEWLKQNAERYAGAASAMDSWQKNDSSSS